MADQIEDVIYSRLQATSGLTALVSTRCYPIRRPADASLPLVVFERLSRFRFSCQADTPESARAVAAQVKAAIGYYADSTTTPVVDGCWPDGSFEDFVMSADLVEVSKDFQVAYRE